MFKDIIKLIKTKYNSDNYICLHEPVFRGNEKKYLEECIDSTYVSSVGSFVDKFENLMNDITQTNRTTAVVNGTAALEVGLRLVGVKKNDEVITQALTFIATANAIAYNNAHPIFLDVDFDTMGLSPKAVSDFLPGRPSASLPLYPSLCCHNLYASRVFPSSLPFAGIFAPTRSISAD